MLLGMSVGRPKRPVTEEMARSLSHLADIQEAVARKSDELDRERRSRRVAIWECRQAGATWAAIGEALGTTAARAEAMARERWT